MALKGDRQIFAETAAFRLDAIKERGYFVMLDSTEGYVKVVNVATTTINVLGCLLHDVVADTSASGPVNYNKAFTVFKGGKVPVVEAGRLKTNVIYTSGTIAVNDKAYVNASGVLVDHPITMSGGGVDAVNNKEIGVFESTADTDGYVTVRFNCCK